MNKLIFSIIFVIFTTWIIIPNKIYAHGFGERYDLPIPLEYFLIGGSLTIILSFVILVLFTNNSININHNQSRSILSPNNMNNIVIMILTNILKIFSVFLFLLAIISGFIGSDNPIENFSAPFIWIIWWVGFGILTPIIGDFWKALNPIKIIYIFLVNNVLKNPEMINKGKYAYPKSLDSWPLIISFLLFAWFENVGNGSNPFNLSILITIYSSASFVLIYLYGAKTWLERGEVFSVYYHIMG